MTEKKGEHRLLFLLIELLVQEWGYETVLQCLADFSAKKSEGSALPTAGDRRLAKERHRPKASEIVDRLTVPDARKELLRALAARLDDKTFLPSAADIRRFLELRGKISGPIKHRQNSFRKVLDLLVSMDDEELLLLQRSGYNGGPTRLGPLSDAIKATGAAFRGADQYKPVTTDAPSDHNKDGGAKSER